MDAHALVETVFFATVVLETTRTPVKEVVKADMSSSARGCAGGDDARKVSRPKNTGERFSVRSSGMRIELLVYISFYVLLYSPETC